MDRINNRIDIIEEFSDGWCDFCIYHDNDPNWIDIEIKTVGNFTVMDYYIAEIKYLDDIKSALHSNDSESFNKVAKWIDHWESGLEK